METKQLETKNTYDAPEINVVELNVEGILCASEPPWWEGPGAE